MTRLYEKQFSLATAQKDWVNGPLKPFKWSAHEWDKLQGLLYTCSLGNLSCCVCRPLDLSHTMIWLAQTVILLVIKLGIQSITCKTCQPTPCTATPKSVSPWISQHNYYYTKFHKLFDCFIAVSACTLTTILLYFSVLNFKF